MSLAAGDADFHPVTENIIQEFHSVALAVLYKDGSCMVIGGPVAE